VTVEAPLPLFAVYGTLRQGGGNAPIWQGLAVNLGQTHVVDYAMYAARHGGFPYAVESVGNRIVVELLQPLSRSDAYELTERLDMLEGVPHLYRRIVVPDPHGLGRLVFMYVPTDDTFARTYDMDNVIEGGDWMRHQATRPLRVR
jgi:gamma-glutamylcyclotransferase (GGCT)/AIG2-like uncharacterized protein YtfP